MKRSPNPDHEADIDLVRRMAAGDEQALAALYDRHAGKMMAVGLHMLRDQASAEDVVHDVLLEAWRKAATFDEERGSPRAWLLVRMRSRCLDRVRAARVRRDFEARDEAAPSTTARPDEGGTLGDGDRLHAALAVLPEAQRVVLERIYFAGLSSQQVADELRCPVGTVKSRVRLAMSSLRSALASQEAL